jgi:TRAP-type C4-dicarboxylate transport system permease small subunit
MKKALKAFFFFNKVVTQILVYAIFILFATMVGLLFYQVIGRYFFGTSPLWVVEIAQYSFVWLSFLGICVAFRKKSHIVVDYFLNKASDDIQTIIKPIIHILILSVGIIIAYGGFVVTRTLKSTLSPGVQMSMAWVYSITIVSGILIFLGELEFIIARMVGNEISEEQTKPIGEKAP